MDHLEHPANRNTPEVREAELKRLERSVDDRPRETDDFSPAESAASERLAALREARSDGEAVSRDATGDALKRNSSPEMDAIQMEKQHRELDSSVTHTLERNFGRDIGEDRLREAREHSTKFQNHIEYQNGLKAAYHDLAEGDSENIVGDLRDGLDRHVDAEQPELPRTVAHEQLHQLSNGIFRHEFGKRIDEGTTEHLSREAIPGLHIRDLPEGYPDEERFVGMLEARVGPTLAHAYLSGDLGPMRKEFDAQLGDGALEQFAGLTRQGRLDEAIDLLKGCPR